LNIIRWIYSKWAINTIKEKNMNSTNYTIGSSGIIMKSGCDTGYFVSGSSILKGGCYTDFSVNNGGKILKNGSETGFIVGSGGMVMQESDRGFNINWMFN
jgi:hypothetical protein